MSTPHLFAKRALALSLLTVLLAGCGGGGDQGIDSVSPKTAITGNGAPQSLVTTTDPRGATPRARPARSPRPHSQVLADPAAAESIAPRAASGTLVPRRIGFGRTIPDTATTGDTRARLQWQSMPGGRIAAALSVRSPQATAVRLGVLVRALPAAATLRIYAQGSTMAHEVAAADVLDAIRANVAAGDDSDRGRTWWAPSVAGAEATLEIELPPGTDPSQVEIALPGLSHLFASPADAAVTPKIGESGACQIDVACSSGYDSESASVARISFIDDGGAFLCTATLLADQAGSRTPYVLTANHCISTQTSASSVETDWFYRAAGCGAATVDTRSRTVSGGATLLYATGNTDTSFLRLAAQPPAGAVFAGWSADLPGLNSTVFDLHHPEGDVQKIASGTLESYQRCTTNRFGGLECAAGNAANANFLNARFTTGTTETGSSGSALFRTIGNTRYVVGQLYGGSASCSARDGTNIYGRFDTAYNVALKQWLGNSPRQPVYRFYNRVTGAHFYTMSTAERDQVIATDPNFGYEGPSFSAYPSAQDGASPVYRFYNTKTRAHFYTINTGERDHVRATDPNYIFEGESWFAQTTQVAGATALYRFYNLNNGVHFFTASADERASVIQTLPSYVNEGIGYYVWPTP